MISNKVEEHQNELIGCKNGRKKICSCVMVLWTNYGGSHITNFWQCSSKQKIGIKANKERKLNKHNKNGGKKAISKNKDDIAESDKNFRIKIEMRLGVLEVRLNFNVFEI